MDADGRGGDRKRPSRYRRWAPRSAINRAYYAAFYAVSAVLLGRGRHFVKHAGVLHRPTSRDLIHPGLLAPEHGKAYDDLFELRLIADYTVTGIDADQATRSLRQAEALVAEMRRLLDAGQDGRADQSKARHPPNACRSPEPTESAQ